jgi:hypothetical protein
MLNPDPHREPGTSPTTGNHRGRTMTTSTNSFVFRAAGAFDRLETRWTSHATTRRLANSLVIVFLLELLLIELKRRGWLPDAVDPYVKSTNHFYAVNLAFSLLLVYEVVELVFSMTHSVAAAVGKQFEILSLILLRSSFKEFTYFEQPIDWGRVDVAMRHILADAGGAILIFLALGLYYRLLRHQKITSSDDEQTRFVATKKVLALVMLAIYAAVGAGVFWHWVRTGESRPFFQTFYTVLIFADFLLVFISMRYRGGFHVLFRNSAFALGTVVIRVALSAPIYYKVGLGLASMVFILATTWAYNRFKAS